MPHCADTHEGDWSEERRRTKRTKTTPGLRLADEEREAIDKAAHAAAQLYPGPDGVALAVTLRGLLERMK